MVKPPSLQQFWTLMGSREGAWGVAQAGRGLWGPWVRRCLSRSPALVQQEPGAAAAVARARLAWRQGDDLFLRNKCHGRWGALCV